MSEFRCAIESAGRAGAKRCKAQCESCLQWFLKRDEGRPMTTVETAGGNYFDYADPRAEQITLDDVAHHLSVNCRFGGAVSDPETGHPVTYSVAEHAINVSDLVIARGHPEFALAALHHDSHEYMWGDWPTPLKRLLRDRGVTVLDALVQVTDLAVGEAFGIDPDLFHHPAVKDADLIMLYREAATFKVSRGIGPHWRRTIPAAPLENWVPVESYALKEAFIAAHYEYGGK